MKQLVWLAIALLSSSAFADTYFECAGSTHDGITVTVSGTYNDSNRMVSTLDIYREGANTLSSNGGTEYRYFGAEDTRVTPTLGQYWNLNANWKGKYVTITHPEGVAGQTSMVIYLDANFDHQFEHATCNFY